LTSGNIDDFDVDQLTVDVFDLDMDGLNDVARFRVDAFGDRRGNAADILCG